MAVYKKKDKTAKQIRKERSRIEQTSTTKEVFEGLDTTAGRIEAWILKYQNRILTVMGVIVLLVVGYLLYLKYIQAPKELEAADELAYPKAYFERAVKATVQNDSLYKMALEGAEGHDGMTGIADRYASTKAGNMARYYAGICYLKLGDYKNAVQYLDDFDSDDEVLNAEAKGAIGDAFSELGGDYLKNALSYYEQALKLTDNSLIKPVLLRKAGLAALKLKQYDKAAGYFETLKEDYKRSDAAKQVDVLLNMAKYHS